MKTIRRYILQTILILSLPLCAYSQTQEQISSAKNKLTKEEVSAIKNRMSDNKKNATSLNSRKVLTDSISRMRLQLDTESTKYRSVEEAAMDANKLLDLIAREKSENKANNTALGFRLSQKNIKNKDKAQAAKDAWTKLMESDSASVQDFLELQERFGDKPTYYINGIEVSQLTVDRIRQSEIVTRNIKVSNTASGNPNGEIWFEITSKAVHRLNLSQEAVPSGIRNAEVEPIEYIEPKSEENQPTYKEVKTEPEKETSKKKVAEAEKEAKKRSVRKVKENIKNK